MTIDPAQEKGIQMNPLEENDVQGLVDMTLAHYRFQYLAAAVEFDLFTLLARHPGLTKQELAARLELRETPIRTLLLCLGSVGLVRRDGDRYFNSPVADRYLTRDRPDNFLARVRMGRLLTYHGMGSFYESLKANTNVGLQHVPGKGPTLYARIGEDPVLQNVFHEFMASFSRQHTLLATIDLAGCERLLDVGGGAEAVNAIALAKRWPQLRVTVLDLPPVAAAARKRVEESGLNGRIEVIGMDCLKEEFPSGFDAVFYAHFLGIFSVEKQFDLVARGARAVKPGGRLLVVGAVPNEGEADGWHAAWLSAYFLTIVNGEGCVLSLPELQKLCGEAGFDALHQTAISEGDAFAITTVVQGMRRA
jgi:ubiquinone/menaquinone biosynthesis C-methylase UbiE